MNIPSWLPLIVAGAAAAVYGLRAGLRESRKLKSTSSISAGPASRTVEITTEPDAPVGFGRKNHWLAVRASGANEVASALALAGVQVSNWASGSRAAYAFPSDYVFVTPPIDGWVLAVGMGLPDPGTPDDVIEWRSMMRRVSERFGETFFFATHRVSSYTAWARYSNGIEKRLFACADDPIWDVGEPAAEERELMGQLPNPEEAESDPGYWERDDVRIPEEEDVLRLAGLWSLDPSGLDSASLPASTGFVGLYHKQEL